MTREDVIRMAREAGVFEVSYPHPAGNMVEVERFAALVAAAEREACAAICDRIASPLPDESLEGWREGYVDGAGACRNLIRARGQE